MKELNFKAPFLLSLIGLLIIIVFILGLTFSIAAINGIVVPQDCNPVVTVWLDFKEDFTLKYYFFLNLILFVCLFVLINFSDDFDFWAMDQIDKLRAKLGEKKMGLLYSGVKIVKVISYIIILLIGLMVLGSSIYLLFTKPLC